MYVVSIRDRAPVQGTALGPSGSATEWPRFQPSGLKAEAASSARRPSLTWNKRVFCSKSHSLELFVRTKLNPHEPPRGSDQRRALHATEPIDERREAKRPVTNFQVIEATFERRFYVKVLVEGQLYPLPWGGWKVRAAGQGNTHALPRREEQQRGCRLPAEGRREDAAHHTVLNAHLTRTVPLGPGVIPPSGLRHLGSE